MSGDNKEIVEITAITAHQRQHKTLSAGAQSTLLYTSMSALRLRVSGSTPSFYMEHDVCIVQEHGELEKPLMHPGCSTNLPADIFPLDAGKSHLTRHKAQCFFEKDSGLSFLSIGIQLISHVFFHPLNMRVSTLVLCCSSGMEISAY